MTSIYDHHDQAFRHVSAYVVLHNGERVATIAFKHPRDGASRLWCYAHWIGTEMVRGYASGFGYDKHTAACAAAAKRHLAAHGPESPGTAHRAFWRALQRDVGPRWATQLRDSGFTVLQAV